MHSAPTRGRLLGARRRGQHRPADRGRAATARDARRRTNLGAGREEFDLEPSGDIFAKGKTGPLRVFRLLGRRPARTASAPGPEAAPLVGRASQVHELELLVDRLHAGAGGVATISGDAGVGKSRLLAELAVHAEARVRWLPARSVSYGANMAYWPFAELLRRWGGSGLDTPAPEVGLVALGRRSSALGVPELAEPLGWVAGIGAGAGTLDPLDAEARRRVVHDAMTQWLRALARDRPTVLALEDIHWADDASNELAVEVAQLSARLVSCSWSRAGPRPRRGSTVCAATGDTRPTGARVARSRRAGRAAGRRAWATGGGRPHGRDPRTGRRQRLVRHRAGPHAPGPGGCCGSRVRSGTSSVTGKPPGCRPRSRACSRRDSTCSSPTSWRRHNRLRWWAGGCR